MFPWEVLITGAVGLAGIGGTLWQGKRAREAQTADLKASLDATAENLRLSLDAENERARLAEKRRVYVKCIEAIGEVVNSSIKIKLFFNEDGEPNDSVTMEHTAALTSLLNSVAELLLVAPESIQTISRRLYNVTIEEIASKNHSEEGSARFREVREHLLVAMPSTLAGASTLPRRSRPLKQKASLPLRRGARLFPSC